MVGTVVAVETGTAVVRAATLRETRARGGLGGKLAAEDSATLSSLGCLGTLGGFCAVDFTGFSDFSVLDTTDFTGLSVLSDLAVVDLTDFSGLMMVGLGSLGALGLVTLMTADGLAGLGVALAGIARTGGSELVIALLCKDRSCSMTLAVTCLPLADRPPAPLH